MALSATKAAAQYVHTGAVSAYGAYSETWMNKSDLLIWMDRAYARLQNILRMEMPKVEVATMEPTFFGKEAGKQDFTPSNNATSSSGSLYDMIPVNDEDAHQIRVGDIFVLPDIFCDYNGGNYSTVKSTALAAGYKPETIRVKEITQKDADEYYLIVSRANGYEAATPTAITTSHRLCRSGVSVGENWATPDAYWAEPELVYNYLQPMTISADMNDIYANSEWYGKQTLEEILQFKKEELLRRFERQLIYGTRKKYVDSNGQRIWEFGGIMEDIRSSTTARDGVARMIDFGGAFEAGRFREILEIFGRYGSPERLVLTGGTMMNILRTYFESAIRVNDELTSKWGGVKGYDDVWTWEAGQLKLNIMRHPIFTEMSTSSNTYSNDMLVIDLNQLNIMHLKNMDWNVRYDVQASNVHNRQHEFFGVVGLKRSPLGEGHGYIYGITNA